VFRFQMTIPDPCPKAATAAQEKLDKELAGEFTAASGKQHEVQGMVFYYPFRDGKETRPMRRTGPRQRVNRNGHIDDGTGNGSGSGFSSSPVRPQSQSQPREQGKARIRRGSGRPSATACAEADEEDEEEEEGGGEEQGDEVEEGGDEEQGRFLSLHSVDMFWTNRLVPQTTAEKLPFYPENCKSRAKCELEGIAENWRGRIKVYLFYSSSFPHIANNKLRLLHVNEAGLCSEKVLFSPTSMASHFKKWLVECHKKFDRDFVFELRTEAESGGNAKFKRLTVGSATSIVIETGTVVCMSVAPRGNNRKREEVFGKVVCFEADTPLPAADERFYGAASVHYTREPGEVYGSREGEEWRDLQWDGVGREY
jgi:hypothetical protein